jgi:RNA 2',3'-cyclic 3'-phosphodiesterase
VESVRAFFAVELGEAARREVAELARRLAGEAGGDGVRWIPWESYHVTLRFLGETPPERLGELVACVGRETARCVPFTLQLGGLHAFPNPRRARIVVLDVEPADPAREDALEALAAAVERGTVAAGFRPEPRPFRGHVTLGRVRPGRRAPPLDGSCAPEPFRVERIVLFRSDLGGDGARYTPLERVAIGSARDAEPDASPSP